MKVSQVIQDFGVGTMWVGGASLFVMAVVGTMSVDIVMMAAMNKQLKEGKVLDACCTMWMWHLISNKNSDPLILLAISPITTAIAIGLSVAYEVPTVGLFLAGGWGVAASVFLLGWLINRIGQCLEVEEPKIYVSNVQSSMFHDGKVYNTDGTEFQSSAPSAPSVPSNTWSGVVFN